MSAHEYGDAKRIEITEQMLIFSFDAATVICRVQNQNFSLWKASFCISNEMTERGFLYGKANVRDSYD